MSLLISSLVLDNFRGYRHLELTDFSELVVFAGENAVGKTNIIEALQLLTTGNSFRKPHADELVSWEKDSSFIQADFTDGKRKVEHRLTIKEGKRSFTINGKRKATTKLSKTLPSILFIPDDLQMIKASSSVRRAAIDALGAQLSETYASLKQQYDRALKQRNVLIKDGVYEGPLFDSWTDNLIIYGARLFVNRVRLFKRLSTHMKKIHADLAVDERLKLVYSPSWARYDEQGRKVSNPAAKELEDVDEMSIEDVQLSLKEFAGKIIETEKRRKSTLVGPHQDELTFYINGKNARMFASQGQQRTLVLTWKIAEVQVVEDIIDTKPVLLLDDVMSELDSNHRDMLTNFLTQSAQTFITTTNLGYFNEDLLSKAHVVELPIEGSRYSYEAE